ncbi:MAG: SMP-30/gluconolactonase/LRE family protein [Alphaproteobacteria bacterium]
MSQLTVLIEGLHFPEGPRWHEGRLWFSDFYAHEVVAVDPSGRRETIVTVPEQPSGLGWLPDGRLLVVSMRDRKVMRRDAGGLVVHADLWNLAAFHCNDMVVDGDGRAYVGNFGFNHYAGEEPKGAALLRVEPDGRAAIAADDLMFPNGTVITQDGRTLVIGETRARRLTAFDRAADGTLSNRRLWADLGPNHPDGICLDAEGAIWVADPRNNVVLRVREGGEVVDRISTGDLGAFACMLGGDDRRTLFVCTAAASGPKAAETRSGRIETVRVAVPGAGRP